MANFLQSHWKKKKKKSWLPICRGCVERRLCLGCQLKLKLLRQQKVVLSNKPPESIRTHGMQSCPSPIPRSMGPRTRCAFASSTAVGTGVPQPKGRTNFREDSKFVPGWMGRRGCSQTAEGRGCSCSPCSRRHRPDAAFTFPRTLDAEQGPDEQRTNLWPLKTASSQRTWVHLHAPAQRTPGLGAGLPFGFCGGFFWFFF